MRRFLLVTTLFLFASVLTAQPLLQEKRIYVVDVTASMEGRGSVETPDVFNTVKKKLQATIKHISDETTEVLVIPFTSKTFQEYSGTIAQKDSLVSAISTLAIKPGDTNIADAWSKAVSNLDSTKINYIFLLTDGLHNCGPSKEELFSRLSDWDDFSQGNYYFAFYVMLTPNAKEQEICMIVDSTPNLWLIESMDIDASLIKTNTTLKKNVFNDNNITNSFSSNNKDVELSKIGLDISMAENANYEIESKSVNSDSYQFKLVEKRDKREIPIDDTLRFNITHNSSEYPFVFFTPNYITGLIANQGQRNVKVFNHRLIKYLDPEINFGKIKFREPFQGPFKALRKYLEPTLDYAPFSWFRPDTTKSLSLPLFFTFNEEAVRASSKVSFIIRDANNSYLQDVTFKIDNGENVLATNTDRNEVMCHFEVEPGRKSGKITGPLILRTTNLDYINDKEVTSDDEVLCNWRIKYKRKCTWILWLLWIITAIAIIALIALLIYGIVIALFYAWVYMSMGLKSTLSSIPTASRSPKMKRNKRDHRKDDDSEEEQEDKHHGYYKNQTTYVLYNNYIIPNGNQSKNVLNRTNKETLDLLGDNEGIIKISDNGEPIFDKDGGTKDGKTLSVKFEEGEGIKEYLDKKDLADKKNSINRARLHDETFKRMAEKYGMSVDELRVFKGDIEPIERLKEQWNCSEKEVWERCRNPYKINRVLHEERDCRTVRLVPWVYHHMRHDGGIEVLKNLV